MAPIQPTTSENIVYADPALLEKIVKSQDKLLRLVTKLSKAVFAFTDSGSDNDVKKEPHGLAKPTLISNDLADFLGKPHGTWIPRTECTKIITEYIKANNLQNPANRKIISPDAALQKLLNLAPTDTFTFFNLQRHLKGHYIKAEATPATTPAAPESTEHVEPPAKRRKTEVKRAVAVK